MFEGQSSEHAAFLLHGGAFTHVLLWLTVVSEDHEKLLMASFTVCDYIVMHLQKARLSHFRRDLTSTLTL